MSIPEFDLEKHLGNDIAEALLSLNTWGISEPVSLSDRVVQKINVGGARFDFLVVDESSAVLMWESEVPDDLLLGGGVGDLIDFLDFTTVHLPRHLYAGDEKEKVVRNTYGKQSKVQVQYQDDFVTYGLDSRNSLLKLGKDLTAGGVSEKVKGFVVEGYRDSSGSMRDSLVFGVSYLDSDSDYQRGVFSLAVPYTPDSARAFNKDLLSWVFSVHDGITNPSPETINSLERYGELNLAEELSGIIRERFPQP